MQEFYLQIRAAHITTVLFSGALFLLRGLALNVFDARWAMAAPLRYLSYTIDTVLLATALLLTTIVQQYPFVHDWLTVKVILLVIYIVLGSFALKRGKTKRQKIVCWIAALLIYAYIISVARAHHPLGFLNCSTCNPQRAPRAPMLHSCFLASAMISLCIRKNSDFCSSVDSFQLRSCARCF